MPRFYDHEDLKTLNRIHLNKRKDASSATDDVLNGSMAPDMEEMKRHGQAMERMKTNTQLQKEGLIPDPIQREE
ncbi:MULTISPECIES: hypothetical protein [Paenibacillus]|uniref:Uncharacterized protein n=1 Tax=Paenibacillus residui TaxID=629724 RepID=A0ABW3DEH7_9BACL|nr:hypothetical protein [Paenibacillus sp. 32O-W]